MALLCTCSNKRENGYNINNTQENNIGINLEQEPNIIDINADEFDDIISGRYNFYSIDIKKDENVYKGRFFEKDENVYKERFFNGTDELFCEIEHIKDNNFLLKYRRPRLYPDLQSPEQQNEQFIFPPENREYWYPSFISKYNGIPFCIIMGEKGGGGTYIYFYYNENQIIMDYKYYSNMNGYLEEGEPEIPIEWLEFNMIFKKE